MDESAAWRMRYDEEAVKVAKCMNQLKQVFSIFIVIFLSGGLSAISATSDIH